MRPFQSEPPRREPRSEGPGAPSSGGGDRTLYVGNLPYGTSQQEIEELFTQHGAGPIVHVHLPMGPDGRMRGFGFVTLGSADAATSAIVSLRDVDLRGRRLMINIAHPRGSGGDRSSQAPRGDRMGGGGGGRYEAREPVDEMHPMIAPARPVEGRRWREAAAPADKKKKKKGGERATGPEPKRREKNRRWNDWDDD